MELVAEKLKNFILQDVNKVLNGLSTQKVPLPALTEKTVVVGVVDLSRFQTKSVCSILPEEQDIDDGYINGIGVQSRFTVTLLFQKSDYETEVKQMFRFTAAFRDAWKENPCFNDTIRESTIENIKYYPDAGNVPFQMTAVEITFVISTDESADFD